MCSGRSQVLMLLCQVPFPYWRYMTRCAVLGPD